jgi:hypothetical protein
MTITRPTLPNTKLSKVFTIPTPFHQNLYWMNHPQAITGDGTGMQSIAFVQDENPANKIFGF